MARWPLVCLLAAVSLAAVPTAAAQSGGRIIFHVGADLNKNELFDPGAFVMSADGRRVQTLPGRLGALKPGGADLGYDSDWTADGSRVAIRRGRVLFTAKPNGTGIRRLAVGKQNDTTPSRPAFSPGGDRIAYSMYDQPRDKGDQIFVVPTAGGAPREFLTRQLLLEPSWAPDGRRIVAPGAEPKGGSPGLWILDTATGGTSLLLAQPPPATAPAWSPDGSLIAYLRIMGGGAPNQVWVTKADGSGSRAITPQFQGIGKVVWSPDGRALAFDTERGIYRVGPDGSGLRLLNKGAIRRLSDWVARKLPRQAANRDNAMLKVLKGTVKIRRPGSRGFVRLLARTETLVRYGTKVDTRRGRVRLTRRGRGGRVRRAVRRGRFTVRRPR